MNNIINVSRFLGRPNLYLSVKMKSGNILNDLRSQMICIGRDDYVFEGPTIIYCPTKKATEDVLNIVKSEAVKCCLFSNRYLDLN